MKFLERSWKVSLVDFSKMGLVCSCFYFFCTIYGSLAFIAIVAAFVQ